MSEYFHESYKKEEIFWDEFPSVAEAVSNILGDDWKPNYFASDKSRRNSEYFYSRNELNKLVFDGAFVNHNQGCFSSVQISLKSSRRNVTIQVKNQDGKLTAEKIIDKKVEPES
jgi:hypothetical protein